MKKKLFCGIMLLAACTMLMVGCKKENSQQQEPDQPTQAKLVAACLGYSFEVTDDMLSVADITVSYYDEKGQLQTEQLKTTSWSKTIQASLPAKLGVRVLAVLKENYNPADHEKVTVARSYSLSTYCLDENGKKVNVKSDALSLSSTYAGDKIPAYFEKYKDHLLQALYTVDAEGNFTYHEAWD